MLSVIMGLFDIGGGGGEGKGGGSIGEEMDQQRTELGTWSQRRRRNGDFLWRKKWCDRVDTCSLFYFKALCHSTK